MIVTPDLYDLYHTDLQVCALQFRQFGRPLSYFGPCQTLSTFEDHRPVLRALEQPGAGRVLVVDAAGSMRVGVMGDRLAEIAARNGWRGVVINGVIRDSRGIDALEIGVHALGTTARRGNTPTEGRMGVRVSFGDITIKPGDWVYADADCVITAPRELSLPA
ncbi:ribonuclease E activity regulator RraA [Sulfitobacter sp. S0837]|nr:ribonuclease E activity regulator RraA [Sulfitobacter maritimus]NUH63791.1 ribonuclease E activity regulator RraA [Sulfitobacter maritimus]NUH65582.1 ribonuclease E activity regulator RraA [Sulfitobacter maritimus]